VETLLKEKENSTNATTVWTKKIAGQTELLLFIAAGPITKLFAWGVRKKTLALANVIGVLSKPVFTIW
jgi:hypothetical protein